MKKSVVSSVVLWGVGLVGFALRRYQMAVDFDPVTGLALPSVAGTALVILLALAAAVLGVLCLREKRSRPAFREHFAPPQGVLPLMMVLGCAVLMGGGGLMAIRGGIAVMVAAGVLAIASGAGFVVLTRAMRRETVSSLVPILPAAFFGPFWVLALYIPAGTDPVLARYYLSILAAAGAAWSFALLGGFFREQTESRVFTAVARWTVIACQAAAGGMAVHHAMIAVGCAAVLTVFLAAQRAE